MNIRIDPQLKGFIGWYFVISSPVWCIFPFWALLGCLFWGNAGFPTKMTEDLRPQARKQMSPGRGKTNCWGELIYIEIWKKSTHTYMHIIAYLQMHQYIYIYCIILYTHMRLWYYLAPAKHWHRKVFPRTFQRATRHANPTYTSQAIDLTQSSSLTKWRGWDGIPESPVSFSLILRECCQLF